MTNNFIGLLLVLIVTAPLYALLPQAIRIYFILLMSICFYAYFNIFFVLTLFYVIALTYIFGLLLYQAKVKSYMIWGAVLTVGFPLLFYKYILIWFSNLRFDGLPVSSLTFSGVEQVLIPVGLSFYTFQCLGYLIDLSKGRFEPETNIFKLAAFVSFFPQILAGPIEKYPDLSHQLYKADRPNATMVIDGITLLLYGLFLKLVVAERLSSFVDRVFSHYDIASSLSILMGFIAFTLQIFADFGGYSFMAIGIASLYGIRLTPNFLQPFCAIDIVDFWQRWHVSLTRWVGEYIYRPLAMWLLGKNFLTIRGIEYSTLFVTWLIIGMWHGALVNFAVFGILQGCLIILTSQCKRSIKYVHNTYSRILSHIFTMLFICLTFGLIRAPDFETYMSMMQRLTIQDGTLFFPNEKLELLIGIFIMIFVEYIFNRSSYLAPLREQIKSYVFIRSIVLCILIVLISFLGYDETSAFIYFQY